jgi:hypothetical protein
MASTVNSAGSSITGLDVLTRLVDKSLVVVDEHPVSRRYHMLETIQIFAREKLDESGETRAAQNRHVEFFLQVVEQAEPKLKSAEQKVWVDLLEAEHNNLRAVFKWAMENDIEVALRLAWALRLYWSMRGLLIEGREWANKILDQTGKLQTTASWARAFNLASFSANRQRDYQSGACYRKKHWSLQDRQEQAGDRVRAHPSGYVLEFPWRASDLAPFP